MTSRQAQIQEDTYFRVMRILQENPDLTQRELAEKLGVSVGGLNYCLKALMDKGWVKMQNFQSSKNKFKYLYYSFDNRSGVYRGIWKASDIIRRLVSRLPFGLRFWASQALAFMVYWPLARAALILDRLGICPDNWPLAYYKDKPFYVLRTDALDRFGTRLEQRFSRAEIRAMLEDAGFKDVRFSDGPPYWCAVGIKG